MPEKKHCDLCNKDVHYNWWSNHCKTKKHLKKVEEQKNIINNTKEIICDKDTEVRLLREQIDMLKEQLKVKDKQINDLQRENSKLNHTTIINNTQNIVHVYGKEDYKNMMTLDEWDDINESRGMNRTRKMLSIALSKQPTMAISNLKDPYIDVNREYGIVKEYLPPIIQEIMDKLPKTLRSIFYNFFNEQRHEYHPAVWKEDKVEADKIVAAIIKQTKENPKGIQEVIKTILYNNKLI
jgi:hypothetical protein